MMRTALSLLLLAGMLGGCADLALLRAHPNLTAPGPCGALARQRLDDIVMSGDFDGDEAAIFKAAYQQCLAQQAHDQR
jgi:hypothetical protein